MATVTVFVCPAAAQGADGACAAGQGTWQAVTIAEPWDPSQVDPAALGEALGAGFVVMATGLVIAWCARMVLRSIGQALGD